VGVETEVVVSPAATVAENVALDEAMTRAVAAAKTCIASEVYFQGWLLTAALLSTS